MTESPQDPSGKSSPFGSSNPPPEQGYAPPPSSGYAPPPSGGAYGAPPTGAYGAPTSGDPSAPPGGAYGMAPGGGYAPAPQGPGTLSESDSKLWAMLSHLSFFVIGIIGPLVVMLVQGEKSPYVRRQAVEALNFHITVAIASVVSAILIIVLIGILMLLVILPAAAILTVLAAIAVNKGEDYRYPVSLRLVK